MTALKDNWKISEGLIANQNFVLTLETWKAREILHRHSYSKHFPKSTLNNIWRYF
jgi:hypothetical protein